MIRFKFDMSLEKKKMTKRSLLGDETNKQESIAYASCYRHMNKTMEEEEEMV
jgi:hypothetical protein